MYKVILIFLIFIVKFTFAQLSNDENYSAFILNNVVNFCSADSFYTNIGATKSGFPKPECWSTEADNDVWFEFTSIAVAVNISIYGYNCFNGSLKYPQIALGTIQNNILTYLPGACNEADNLVNSNPGFTNVYVSNLQIGAKYYIRIDGKNNNTGTFKLCINNFMPPVLPGQDCISNSSLCSKNTITQVSLNGAGNDKDEGINSCLHTGSGLQSENNSVWYTFTIAKSGILTFVIDPNNSADDLDFALYRMNNEDCAKKNVVRCSAAHCVLHGDYIGPTGLNMNSKDTTEGAGCPPGAGFDNWVKYLDVIAGETYALLINNYSDMSVGSDNGFSLSFGGSCEFVGPVADFNYTVNSPCIGTYSYTFIDKSTDASEYTWYFGEGANPSTANTIGPHTINYSTPGVKSIVLLIKGSNDCEVVKNKKIILYDNPQIIDTSQTICQGDTAKIFVNRGLHCFWNNGMTTNPLIIAPFVTSEYYVEATDSNGCKGSDSITVTVKQLPPKPVFSSNSPVCSGDTIKLFCQFLNNVSYNWSGPNMFYSDKQNPEISGCTLQNSGIFSLNYILNGCNGKTSEIEVYVQSPPVNFLPLDTTLCDINLILKTKKEFKRYLWQDGYTGSVYNVTLSGTYILTITDEANCKAIDSMIVTRECQPVIIIPNSFTPDNDGINDKFKVVELNTSAFEMKIFNRWGILVFQTNKPEWDGKNFNGVEMPQGIYIVMINYEGIFGGQTVKRVKNNGVFLLR